MRIKKPRICSENDIHKHEKTNSPTQVQKQYTRSDPHTPRDAQKANDRRQEMEKVDRKNAQRQDMQQWLCQHNTHIQQDLAHKLINHKGKPGATGVPKQIQKYIHVPQSKKHKAEQERKQGQIASQIRWYSIKNVPLSSPSTMRWARNMLEGFKSHIQLLWQGYMQEETVQHIKRVL